MATGTRGKKTSKFPKLYSFVGGGQEFLPSELPTLRQCLQYNLLIEERSIVESTIRDRCKEVNKKLKEIWFAVNPLLPLHNDKSVVDRLVKEYTRAQNVSRDHANPSTSRDLLECLDKLFDILKCQCVISACGDSYCDGCVNNAHIKCSCSNKIPVKELRFIYEQRIKVGIQSSMQISSVDQPETERIARSLKRKADDAERAEKAQNISQPSTSALSSDSDIIISDAAVSTESEYESDTSPRKNYNRMDISKISAASIRYGVSNRATAAISTATLASAIEAKLIHVSNAPPVIDHNKIKRSKEKMMVQEHASKSFGTLSEVKCIFFDGRKDATKIMAKMDDGKYHPSVEMQDHYSICSEPGSDYITHLTVPKTEDPTDTKAAEHLADIIHEWMIGTGLCEHLQAIGGDSTNTNTGWRGGAITHLERKLGRKLIWLICALHTNELPLRHLIKGLDGDTLSDNKFRGPVGKLIHEVLDMPVLDDIPSIDVDINLPELSEEVLNDLSGDQKYLFDIVTAIKNQHVSVGLKYRKIGPHHHARWLNLANRLCRMWCSDHKMNKKNSTNLKLIVQFVVSVYAPQWFAIKTFKKWTDGPTHVLTQVRLIRPLDKRILKHVTPSVQSTAWYAHPELVLQAMLVSEDMTLRDFAVEKILEIRGDSLFGDTSVRPYRVPHINLAANKLSELLFWSSKDTQLYEPLLTCRYSREQLIALIHDGMTVPKFPVHGQGIERCVKAVTQASQSVFGEERRDGFIKATLAHRKMMASNDSKKDLMGLFD